MSDKQQQVIAQCKAVAHLADALATVHRGTETLLVSGACPPGHLDSIGQRTAECMETLGDMLNSLDASDDSDSWMEPVFAEAQRLWPSVATETT